MNAFIILLCIIFAILNIVLFFKIWRMTNDIRKIALKGDVWDARKAILVDDKDDIKKCVLNRIANVIISMAKEGTLTDSSSIVESYRGVLDKYDINIPDVMMNIKSLSDLKNLLHD